MREFFKFEKKTAPGWWVMETKMKKYEHDDGTRYGSDWDHQRWGWYCKKTGTLQIDGLRLRSWLEIGAPGIEDRIFYYLEPPGNFKRIKQAEIGKIVEDLARIFYNEIDDPKELKIDSSKYPQGSYLYRIFMAPDGTETGERLSNVHDHLGIATYTVQAGKYAVVQLEPVVNEYFDV